MMRGAYVHDMSHTRVDDRQTDSNTAQVRRQLLAVLLLCCEDDMCSFNFPRGLGLFAQVHFDEFGEFKLRALQADLD